MDAFDDNFEQTEVDPAAEFLAREKDQLAGLEDELEPAALSAPISQLRLDGMGIFLFFFYMMPKWACWCCPKTVITIPESNAEETKETFIFIKANYAYTLGR